jgi:hypothetical protein
MRPVCGTGDRFQQRRTVTVSATVSAVGERLKARKRNELGRPLMIEWE